MTTERSAMYRTAATVALIGMFVAPIGAQSRRSSSQGIPPGQMPPAGQCRVWYDGVPPGRQPRATSCRDAERVAARDRNARVIYGSNTLIAVTTAGGILATTAQAGRSRVRRRTRTTGIQRAATPIRTAIPIRAGRIVTRASRSTTATTTASTRAARTAATAIRSIRIGTAATGLPITATKSATDRRRTIARSTATGSAPATTTRIGGRAIRGAARPNFPWPF